MRALGLLSVPVYSRMQARSSHSMRYTPVIKASFQNFSVDSRLSETFLDLVELDGLLDLKTVSEYDTVCV